MSDSKSGSTRESGSSPEPDKSLLFEGLRQAVLDAGDRIVFLDTHILYLAKKPE